VDDQDAHDRHHYQGIEGMRECATIRKGFGIGLRTMPLGPRVLLTRSETAMAPMTTDILASAPLKAMAPWPRTEGVPFIF
jgi:hypothetical protein